MSGPETQRPLALVTGASSGIGAEFARQLAARSHDLVLTARRKDRLAALAAELAGKYTIRADFLVADLGEEAGIAAVETRLAQGDVHLLVNNAGFGIATAFAKSELASQSAMLSVHILAPMRLMHVALPHMIARRGGGVINVASLASFISLPGNANYSATKAYLMRFSRSVHLEVRRTGVTVQALCPGFVVTEFHDDQERVRLERKNSPAFLWMPANRVVADSLKAFDRHRSLVIPSAIYKVAYWIAKLGIADAMMPLVQRRL
jgi:uncharacterized protein